MSRWCRHAEALAAHLVATVEWCAGGDAVPVMVDRKLELNSIAEQLVARDAGAGVTILFRGARNPDPKANKLRMGTELSIFCMANPLVGLVACDDLAEAIAEAAHGWSPPGTICTQTERLEVTDVDLLPPTGVTKGLVVYKIEARCLRLGE